MLYEVITSFVWFCHESADILKTEYGIEPAAAAVAVAAGPAAAGEEAARNNFV